MKEITANAVENLLNEGNQLHIIDVREDEEVAQGMIPSAKHIPLGYLESRLSELNKSTDYILVCRSGRRSERACSLLESQGFHVSNMVGGMLAWEGNLTSK